MCHLQFLYWNYLFHVAYVKIDYFFLSYLLVSLHKCYFVSIFHLVTFQISRNFWFTLFCSSLFFSTVNNYFWTCKTYGLLYLPQNDCWQFESHPATKVHVKKYLQFVGPFSRCTFYLSHLLFSCLSCWCLSKKKKIRSLRMSAVKSVVANDFMDLETIRERLWGQTALYLKCHRWV